MFDVFCRQIKKQMFNLCCWQTKSGCLVCAGVGQGTDYLVCTADSECVLRILNVHCGFWMCTVDTECVLRILNVYYRYWICTADTECAQRRLNVNCGYKVCTADSGCVLRILSVYCGQHRRGFCSVCWVKIIQKQILSVCWDLLMEMFNVGDS